MTLGQKLRQTRLSKGLSQSQVAGDCVTRNMLSQIENDLAAPSMSSWQWFMISETEKNMRGIKQTLSVERVIPIELLYRKRELEVRLRKR